MEQVPAAHNREVEKAKTKARSLIKKVVVIFQGTSIIIGRLDAADLDKMGPTHFPSCKLSVTKPKRYSIENTFQFKIEDQGIYFVNKPEMIMNLEEIAEKYPEIFREVHVNIRKGVWDGI